MMKNTLDDKENGEVLKIYPVMSVAFALMMLLSGCKEVYHGKKDIGRGYTVEQFKNTADTSSIDTANQTH